MDIIWDRIHIFDYSQPNPFIPFTELSLIYRLDTIHVIFGCLT